MIAFYGYDGFLYSIGYLAGWIVALFVIAEPLKRLGKFTFADALDSQFHSRGIKLAAAISTLVVSIFYLIPQMVGAGALIKPLLGLPHWRRRAASSASSSSLIVVTAGMVSTTWVQFIKGGAAGRLLPAADGHDPAPRLRGHRRTRRSRRPRPILPRPGHAAEDADWPRTVTASRIVGRSIRRERRATATRLPRRRSSRHAGRRTLVNGLPQGKGEGSAICAGRRTSAELPDGETATGPLGPLAFLRTLQQERRSCCGVGAASSRTTAASTTVYYPKPTPGDDLLRPARSPTFAGVRSDTLFDKLDFLSLMLALFCGTASLPHILIRYYTVKDQAAARKSTVVGIASIGFFYVLTLFLGLGAMTSGALDVTDSNMAAPLLARSFGELLFAMISAIAFTTVLGTVSGLIMAASGAVAHDLLTQRPAACDLNDHDKVRAGKIAAVVVGVDRDGARHPVREDERHLPRRLGVQRRRLGQPAGAGDAAVLEADDQAGHHRRDPRRHGRRRSAWILLSAQAFQDVYGLTAGDGAGALQPAGDRDDPAGLPGAGRGVAADAPAGGPAGLARFDY